MSKSKEILQAQQLRRQGWSIKDIAKKLKVSRSSASVWCREIHLTKKQKEVLLQKQIEAGSVGRLKGALSNQIKRENAIAEARNAAMQQIQCVTNSDLFYLGLGIYWGEGVKSRSGQAAIVNSDPRILKTMIRWFIECLGVNRAEFRPYVYISAHHKPREKLIMAYWEKELCLPASQFKTPIYIEQRPKQTHQNHNSYFGVVALRVLKSTNLKYRILSLLEVVNQRLE
jgi:hypothetical protein